MDVESDAEELVAKVAAAMGEVGRARMLLCLADGHARTSTELSVVADVSPSTASAHLARLSAANLIKVFVQGKHRYYSLAGKDVGEMLEKLTVLATAGAPKAPAPRVPNRLRQARTCYDHMAGATGVALHDRLLALGWLAPGTGSESYVVTEDGLTGFGAIGVDVEAARALRRRFACACLDWSERTPHLAGALGAAILKAALARKWVTQDLDSRALSVTDRGKSELLSRFGVRV